MMRKVTTQVDKSMNAKRVAEAVDTVSLKDRERRSEVATTQHLLAKFVLLEAGVINLEQFNHIMLTPQQASDIINSYINKLPITLKV